MTGTILLIDDDPAILRALKRLLRPSVEKLGLEIFSTSEAQEALQLAQQEEPELIICDQRMPGILGTELLRKISDLGLSAQHYIVSGYADFDQITEAFNQGVIHQFIAKPWDERQLLHSIDQLFNIQKMDGQPLNSDGVLFHGMLSQDPKMLEMFQQLTRLSNANAPINLSGETGTGKELAAQAIHLESHRRDKSFVAVNCANFTDQMMEAELFGHKKGAFTGAVEDRIGLLQEADGGTLFLDEVTTLPLALQAKLLRVLQERRFRPVGGNHEYSFDVQLISASSQSIQDAVASGAFRPDLQYRLEVLPVHIPPLRQRPVDIIPLLRFFLNQLMLPEEIGLTERLQSQLKGYSWPGNVRQLYNVAQYLAAMCDRRETLIDIDLLPQHIICIDCPERQEESADRLKPLQQLDVTELQQLLDKHQGNRTATAESLGISRMTLWRRMKELAVN
ncbi:MAG: sigma-54-dependent Fis family transcriptional regulator [Amphritea sp.]|nr:sigma-54-dependent Fis family transcriptional regulator [Amphritea sp.]MBQ0782765.1 sigma-54-dependent Fis family transcriptional regulator [Amphritea sp.]